MNKLTLIYPYYNSEGILQKQLEGWNSLAKDLIDSLEVILVDDGSPQSPALPVILRNGPLRFKIRLYRVLVDIPWNQHGARNLGAQEADHGWLFMSDIDHQLPEESIRALMEMKLNRKRYYTLQRVTAVKKEDGNLKYDLMTDAYGKPKPHPNTFLVTREVFWRTGGYDEDYCGVYGGDGPFMRWLKKAAPGEHLQEVVLIRWTRDLIPDASQSPEYREKYRALYRTKFEKKGGGGKNLAFPKDPIRFPWERLI
jgi:glycosyltransferase involved in cell wall biosynthesis